MPAVNRKPIFDAVRAIRGGQKFNASEVAVIDRAIDEAFAEALSLPPEAGLAAAPASARRVSPKGIALIHSFEQCRLEAYPDPGSKDGNPWTIGWGSTGPDIKRGTAWTQAECDARFDRDINAFAAKVEALVAGVPTNQNQFDALVSLAYNIGVDALRKSTVLRKHRAGEYHDAAAAFSMWVKNDGKVMRGLVRRRAAEADLYDDPVEPQP